MHKMIMPLMLLVLSGCSQDSGPSASIAAECEPRALNILLTNDDGYDQPGIVALHRALVADGHFVIRVAPSRNFSGASASLTYQTFTAPHRPDDEFEAIYAVEGSPATMVLLGATALFPPESPVDLVVSGINNGPNLGPMTTGSGTVGAVVAAKNLLMRSVSGIAVSTGRLADESAEENAAHVARVADFVAGIISNAQCAGDSFIANGQSLNINYPRLATSDLKGIRIARQGTKRNLDLSFAQDDEGGFVFQYRWVFPEHDIPDSDVILFEEGYVTIVPLDADYSAEPAFDPATIPNLEP